MDGPSDVAKDGVVVSGQAREEEEIPVRLWQPGAFVAFLVVWGKLNLLLEVLGMCPVLSGTFQSFFSALCWWRMEGEMGKRVGKDC